jgi:hypothetical protein
MFSFYSPLMQSDYFTKFPNLSKLQKIYHKHLFEIQRSLWDSALDLVQSTLADKKGQAFQCVTLSPPSYACLARDLFMFVELKAARKTAILPKISRVVKSAAVIRQAQQPPDKPPQFSGQCDNSHPLQYATYTSHHTDRSALVFS